METKDIISRHTDYLVTLRGYSENTATAYEKDLRAFASWMRENRKGTTWRTTTREDIDAYVGTMVAHGRKPSTTNRALSSISSMYNYLKREGYGVDNPCRYESRRKIGQTQPNTIPAEDIRAAYEKSTGVTKVMLGLLAVTGMRIQELLDIEWRDINFKDTAIRVTGKGNKQRTVYATDETLSTLANVAAYYPTDGRVFKMEQREARFLIWQALKATSSARQLSPHAIRHTMATTWAKNGENAPTIARALGHNDIRTTQKYIDLAQTDTRTASHRHAIV